MERAALLEQLEIVEPALSDSDLIPVLTNFWFDGERVMAYNDQIAISVPCKTEFHGAVPGKILLDMLRASQAKTIEVVAEDDSLNIRAGSARIKLGLLPPSQFLFDMPAPPKSDEGIPLATQDLKPALECCMMSVSNDTSVPDYLGITIMPRDKDLLFYATNGHTISRAKLNSSRNPFTFPRAILSGKFVAQLLRLVGRGARGNLVIASDHSIAQVGSVTLFGRLIESSKPLPLEDTYSHHVPANVHNQLYQIPSALRLILERAVIITDGATDQTSTQVTVKNGTDGKRRMVFKSQSQRGEITDRMEVTDQQPDVEAQFRAKLVKTGIGSFDKMLVTEQCLIMSRDQFNYLVATVGG
jgi:DNA polymerase III sliding clamp (beta) subunit (PCNA family)